MRDVKEKEPSSENIETPLPPIRFPDSKKR